jgi:hypothetical protein
MLHTYDKEFSVGISYDCNNIFFACRERRRMYIVEKERKEAQCTCRRMEKVPKIGRQFPCSGQ